MPIKVSCACGKKLAVKDELAGKKVTCPACQKLLSIPKPKVQAESLDDEWDLGDSAEEDFADEPSDAPAKSRGGKSSASRGAVSRKSSVKGKKSKSSNRGLVIGLSAGGGVLVIALLAWMLWPAAPAANVAVDPPANQEQSSVPASGDAVKPINSFPHVVGAQQPLTLKGDYSCVAFSPDGRWMAAGTFSLTKGPAVKVWDTTSGQELHTLIGHANVGVVSRVAFSPDGKRLASASLDQTVKVWDVASGQETLTLKGHTNSVKQVVFSADGTRLASASLDDTVKVWDAASGTELLMWKGYPKATNEVAFSPDWKRLALAHIDPMVRIWDATSGQVAHALKGHVKAVADVAFSADGNRLASASFDGTAKLWDATSGQELRTLTGHTGVVLRVVFSVDGKRLATAGEDKTIRVWDAGSGNELLKLEGHSRIVRNIAISPDGNRLASESDDKTLKVWDVSALAAATTVAPSTPVTSTPANPPATASSIVVFDQTPGGVPIGTNYAALVPNGELPPALTQLPDWLKSEVPFDVSQYWITVPPEQNAASLYLDAFYEFAPHMEVYFPKEVHSQRTFAASQRARRSLNLQKAGNDPQAKPNPAERDAVLQLHAVGFQKLLEAQQRPDCLFEVNWAVPNHVLIPIAAREVVRVGKFHVERDLEQKNFDACIRTIDSLLRLSRDLRRRTPFAFQQTADAIAAATLADMLIPALKSPDLKVGQCDELLKVLVRHESALRVLDPFLADLRGDYVLKRILLHDVQQQAGEFAESQYKTAFGSVNATRGAAVVAALNPGRYTTLSFGAQLPPPALGDQLENILKGMKPADFDIAAAFFKEKYQIEADGIGQPYLDRVKAFTAWQKKLRDTFQSIQSSVPPNTPREQAEAAALKVLEEKSLRGLVLASFFTSQFENNMRNQPTAAGEDVLRTTRLSGAQALVALRRWYGTHAEPPTDLAVVCREAGLSVVPRDAFGDGPLRMATFAADTPIQHSRRIDLKVFAGETVIYSLGNDGVDDQARKGNEFPDLDPGDWLFRLQIPQKAIPVTPAPAAAPIQ